VSGPSAGDRLFRAVQAWLKYVPFEWAARLRGIAYGPFLAHAGANLRIYDGVTIKYPSGISIGDNVTVNVGCILVGLAPLEIGNDVMIGAGSKLVTSTHQAETMASAMRHQGLSALPIRIGSDVWLGFDVKVLGGSTLGTGAIVAAGGVVPSGMTVPDYTIAAGVPARIVRDRRVS
jgi:maltose O-acetyltransferase